MMKWAMDCRWGKRGGELEVWTVEVENCSWVDVYASRAQEGLILFDVVNEKNVL